MTDSNLFNVAHVLDVSALHLMDPSPGRIKVKNMKSETQLEPANWVDPSYQPGIARAAIQALDCMSVGVRDAERVRMDNEWAMLSGHVAWQQQCLLAAERVGHMNNR